MASYHQLQKTGPDNRIEPAILTELTVDDGTQSPTVPTSHRMLTVALLISVLAHATILALAATAARQQTQTPPPVPASKRPSTWSTTSLAPPKPKGA